MKSFATRLSLLLLPWITACAPALFRDHEKQAREFQSAHPSAFAEFQHAGHVIHYAAVGDPARPKIVFVHGSPGNWGAFLGFLEDHELTSRAYVISVDRPGYGGSSPGVPELSLAAQARALLGALELGDPSKPAVLVGHSYGGAVVARMAMELDPRISAIIIVAGSVDPALERTKWFQYPAEWPVIRWLVPDDLRVCNEEIFALKAGLDEALPLWAGVRARTLVIQGTQDDLVPPGNADFVERQLPGRAEITRLEGMNHFIPWRRPDVIRDKIKAELARIDSSPTRD